MPKITLQADPLLSWLHLRRLLEEAADVLGGSRRCAVHGSAEEGWTIEAKEDPPPPPPEPTYPPSPYLYVHSVGDFEGKDGVVLLGDRRTIRPLGARLYEWVTVHGREEGGPRVSDLSKPVQRVVDLLLKLEDYQQEAVLGFCESAFSILEGGPCPGPISTKDKMVIVDCLV